MSVIRKVTKHFQTVYIRGVETFPKKKLLSAKPPIIHIFGISAPCSHFLFMPGLFWGPLGVWGLLIPWYWYFAFFSLGFRIWGEVRVTFENWSS